MNQMNVPIANMNSLTDSFRVAVMGAGAVGGFVGGLLAQSGVPVTLIARGDHLRAIQTNGLRIKGQIGDFIVPIDATDDPSKLRPVDLILFTVKTYHNSDATRQLLEMVDGSATILTLQNGANTWEELSNSFGTGRVLPGAMYIEAKLGAPGVVEQQGNVYRIVLGEPDGTISSRVQAIGHILNRAGIPTQISSDVLKILWTKWIFIVALAGLTSASRAPMADLLKIDASRELARQIMEEVEAVGRKRGINLDSNVVDQTFAYMDAEAESLEASMYTDLLNGRPLELDALNGAVSRLGRELGVATPVNDTIYGLLKVHDINGRRLTTH